MPLRLRRGTNAERLTITPIEGELIYTTDSKKVYIGDGTTPGGIDIVTAAGGSLDGSLNLNTFDITGVGNVNIVGQLNNGTLSIRQNIITSLTPQSEFGHTIGVLKLGGTVTDVVEPHLQIVRNWENNKSPIEKTFGISSGVDTSAVEFHTSRGTIEVPQTLTSGDWIFANRFFGHDGNNHIISSVMSYSVDNSASILPGIVPGKMTILTSSSNGNFNTLSFDSRGFLGINKSNPTESLDVNGGGLFNGTVRSAGFIGSVYADDSTLVVDGNTGNIFSATITASDISSTNLSADNITNVTSFSGDVVTANSISTTEITIEGNHILPANPISQNGYLVGSINIGGSVGDPLEPLCQIVRNWEDLITPFEKRYGLSDGFACAYEDVYTSRGSIASPTSVQAGDFISNQRFLAHDGNDYQTVCGMSFAVDPNGSVDPGLVPGKITFTTTSDLGFFHVLSFDSRGYLGVNTFNTREALDVTGNGIFTGNVTASSFKGTFVGDDSTLIIDGATSAVTASRVSTTGITLENNRISPANPITQNGYLVGTINFGGSSNDPLEPLCQIVRSWENLISPFEIRYGISNGFACAYEDVNTSRGTVASPLTLQPGDFISNQRFLGHDGTDYVTSCAMSCSVDPGASIAPGLVPGRIAFTTTNSATGFFNLLSFDSRGYLGINTFNTREALDVTGNGIFTGTVSAVSFNGSIISNDSMVVFDDNTGNLQGNEVTANGILYVTNSTPYCSVQVNGYANRGGTGYHDFLSATNTYGSATNPNKHFRLDATGTLEIVNSAYTSTILSVTDTGNVSAAGYVQFGSFTTVQRNALTAANGMVIYNTTANRFQGYQNGAWINLDDGTAAP